METRSIRRGACVLLTIGLFLIAGTTASAAVASAASNSAPIHPHKPASIQITDFPTAQGTFPGALTSGPGGLLWFAEDISDSVIGSFDPLSHSLKYYTLNMGIYAFKAQGIVTDRFGNLWISANGTYAYKFDPTTEASENFKKSVTGSEESVTVGPDGNIWFSGDSFLTSGCALFSANPVTDVFTQHTLRGGNCVLTGITTGQDGNLWFLDESTNSVGEYNISSGKASEFPLPTQNAFSLALTPGPDDTLWFTEYNADKIGMINIKTHAITEFDIPTPNTFPRSITMGPDGNIWFTEERHPDIGKVDVSTGRITEYSVTSVDPNGSHSFLDGITTGSDGNLWVTDEEDQLLRVSMSPGYWLAGRDGGVFAFGSSRFFGSLPAEKIRPNEPVVAMAPTPDGNGYWLVGSDGGVFGFGDARFFGSLPSERIRPSQPIVAIASTPDGDGYWLVGGDGGVFSFGDARFFGSLPSRGIVPADPISGILVAPSRLGYWLIGSDGGVFAFGDAGFFGSVPSRGIDVGSDVAGSDLTADGSGYWLAGSDGDVFAFGNAGYHGNDASGSSNPAVGIANDRQEQGYWLAQSDGSVSALGGSSILGSLPGIGVTLNSSGAIVTIASEP